MDISQDLFSFLTEVFSLPFCNKLLKTSSTREMDRTNKNLPEQTWAEDRVDLKMKYLHGA